MPWGWVHSINYQYHDLHGDSKNGAWCCCFTESETGLHSVSAGVVQYSSDQLAGIVQYRRYQDGLVCGQFSCQLLFNVFES